MHEFHLGTIKQAKFLAFKYETKRKLKNLLKKILGRPKFKSQYSIKSRYTEFEAKKIVIEEKLGLVSGKNLSWFYTAFERGDSDPLTNFTLNYIFNNVNKNKEILITGCGTGIMAFHLADCGFSSVEGRDLLIECINIANRLKQKFNYKETIFKQNEGFKPSKEKKYDVITALHWVFSAWSGNYGNEVIENPKDANVREKLLNNFFNEYSQILNKDGIIIVELTDAVADYRDPFDHPLGLESINIYPVRFNVEQVRECGKINNLELIDYRLSVSYGHQPRTTFILKRI